MFSVILLDGLDCLYSTMEQQTALLHLCLHRRHPDFCVFFVLCYILPLLVCTHAYACVQPLRGLLPWNTVDVGLFKADSAFFPYISIFCDWVSLFWGLWLWYFSLEGWRSEGQGNNWQGQQAEVLEKMLGILRGAWGSEPHWLLSLSLMGDLVTLRVYGIGIGTEGLDEWNGSPQTK